MTLAQISDRISFLTGSNVTNFTYKDRTSAINKWYQIVHSTILQSQDESGFDDKNNTTFPWKPTNLVANQQDYSLPADCIKIKRLELSYDGVNWAKANPLELGETSKAVNDPIVTANNFSTSNPFYNDEANSVLLYPIPTINVTAGLKLWFDRNVTEFTWTSEASNELLTGTKSPGFDGLFHDVLALGASYEWNSSKKKDKSLYQDIQIMLDNLKKHYGNKNKDRAYSFSPYLDNFN